MRLFLWNQRLRSFQVTSSQAIFLTKYRGSVPFFWGHTNIGYSPKPEIVLQEEKDPLNSSTDKHFERMIKTYGAPIKILNLVKKESKNEQKLGYIYDRYLKKIASTTKKFMKSCNDLSCEWFDFFKVYNTSETELVAYMQKLGNLYLKEVKPTVLDFTPGKFGVGLV